MIAATFDAQSVLILNEAPDWVERPRMTVEGITQYEESLSGRESRRGYSQVLRTKLSFRVTLDQSASIPFAAALRTYQAQPVIVPVWPTVSTWAARDDSDFIGLRLVYKEDWSQCEVFYTTEPTWPADTDKVVFVIWSRLEQRELTWHNATTATFGVVATETGKREHGFRTANLDVQSGPAIAGSTGYLWTQRIDGAVFSEKFSLNLIREQIGFGRSPIETLYPQENARESTASCVLSSLSSFSQALYFASLHIAGQSFWMPALRSSFLLASDVSSGSTAVTATTTPGVEAGDYLWFIDPSQTSTNRCRQVSSVSGTTVNLSASVGPLTASQTVCAPLSLVRFEKPRLEFEWVNASVATLQVAYVEVPPEYTIPADETANVTIGALPVRAYLYEFLQTIGGTTVLTKSTSHEYLLISSGSWVTRKIDHGPIRQSLNIDRDEVEIRSEIIAGDPLLALTTGRAESPVRVVIRQCDVSGISVSNVSVVFTGEITSCSVRGSRITAKAVSAGTVFDRLYPRFRMQVGCNHALFSTGCGLTKSDWKFTGTIASPLTPGYPFAINLTSLTRVTGTMPTITAGWFGGGWVEFGTGSSMVTRAILTNTAASGGALQLSLARDPYPFPSVGGTVALYPGCDGAFATCSAKFVNQLNFGGHPFMPPSNPSLVKVSKNIGGSKK